MTKELKVMNGKDLLKGVNVNDLNGFIDKVNNKFNVFVELFTSEDFDFIKFAKDYETTKMNTKEYLTRRYLDKYDLVKELREFIEYMKEDEYTSNDSLKDAMNLMCVEECILEAVLNKDNIQSELFFYNMIKGFTTNPKNNDHKFDMRLLPIDNQIKLTLESLIPQEELQRVIF
jgi:hypothetical protein